jgi:ABC-type sugar transport system permease subunit
MSDAILRGGFKGWLARAKLTTVLWLLMFPAVAALLVFTYLPNIETIKYSFYSWDGSMTEEFTGLENFHTAFFGDPLFWKCFSIIGILLVANLIKMWPSIFAAIVLHRMKSARAQYVYRVLFVIPMVIPGLVVLLLWKSFFNANVGIFNGFLRGTGLMSGLAWFDHHWPPFTAFMAKSVMVWDPTASIVFNVLTLPLKAVPVLFGSPWGLIVWGVWVLLLSRGFKPLLRYWLLLPILLGLCLMWGADIAGLGLLTSALLRGIPLIAAAWFIGYRLKQMDPFLVKIRVRRIAYFSIGLGILLAISLYFWTSTINSFDYGRPAWIGDGKLILPAVILWGFPWIGTVGVLIYLAGLSNISQEVYEAAELDGIGFWGKIFKIEVPLIMTQVRINLIFLTIATLGEYGFFLILLGPAGGPDNAGLTPGLYMYQQAFMNSKMGYACALGLVLSMIILYITMIYQKHLKVDK